MKKLFFIVALCVIIGLGGAYLKSRNITTQNNSEAIPAQETISEDSPQNIDGSRCDCHSECLCENDDDECDCSEAKSVCTCQQENGETVTLETIETNNEDIEEDSEQTIHEEETIVSDEQ